MAPRRRRSHVGVGRNNPTVDVGPRHAFLFPPRGVERLVLTGGAACGVLLDLSGRTTEAGAQVGVRRIEGTAAAVARQDCHQIETRVGGLVGLSYAWRPRDPVRERHRRPTFLRPTPAVCRARKRHAGAGREYTEAGDTGEESQYASSGKGLLRHEPATPMSVSVIAGVTRLSVASVI